MIVANRLAKSLSMQKRKDLLSKKTLPMTRQAGGQLHLNFDRRVPFGRQLVTGRSQQDCLNVRISEDSSNVCRVHRPKHFGMFRIFGFVFRAGIFVEADQFQVASQRQELSNAHVTCRMNPVADLHSVFFGRGRRDWLSAGARQLHAKG